MNSTIIYKDTHEFTSEELERLFLSFEWSSGHYPDRLVVAMRTMPQRPTGMQNVVVEAIG